MNFLELQSHIAAKASAETLPYPTDGTGELLRWQQERDELMRHYEGKSCLALAKAFPNEEEVILQYRKDIDEPSARGPMLKAIDEIWRLFSGSRYSVKFGNTEFESWATAPSWDGMSMVQWVLRVAYACRVTDSNGYLALIPTGPGLTNNRTKVGVDLLPVHSKTIVEERPDLLAWVDKDGFLGLADTIHYLTDEVYAVSKPQKNDRVLMLVYEHNAERVPAVKLGGRTVIEMEKGRPRSREISDFAHALQLMNRLNILDNQLISVTLSTIFPIKLVDGVDCAVCSGRGRIAGVDAQGTQTYTTCGTCHGAGQVFPISPLKGYFSKPRPVGVTPEERTAMATRKPIEIISPGVSEVQFIADRRDKLKTELDQALDIQRAQTFAQSGASKEQDRQTMYIQIARISEYWFNIMLKSVLEIAQIYWEPIASKRGTISVTAPVSFDIKNESDLLAEFVDMFANAPAIIRYPAFIDYISKRFANDQSLLRAMLLAVQYAPLTLANEAEKRGKPEPELTKATWAAPLLFAIMRDTNGFMARDNEPMPDSDILKELEARMQTYLTATSPVVKTLADSILNEIPNGVPAGADN